MVNLPYLTIADWLIIVFLIVFTAEGWRSGFVQMAGSLAGLMLAVVTANIFHSRLAGALSDFLPMTASYAGILAYLFIAVLTMVAVAMVLTTLLRKILLRFSGSFIDSLAGSVVSLGNGIIITTIVLLLAENVPFATVIRHQLKSSYLVGNLTSLAKNYLPDITRSLAGTASGALRFFTVRPGSAERIKLNVSPENWDLVPDEQAEADMLDRVNEFRTQKGVGILKRDDLLRQIARFRSHDMFIHRYFSHYDESGRDVSYYLDSNGIPYRFIGENLAYAPDVQSAMDGLVKSDTHFAIMLDRKFTRTGIGVIDSPKDGKIFTQIFAD